MIITLVLCFCLFSGMWSGSYSNEAFTTNLLKSFGSEKNLIISPLSLKMALGISALGAKYDTANEIYKVLGYNEYDAEERLARDIESIVEMLNDLKSGITLQIANVLLISSSLPVKKRYMEDVRQIFPRTTIKHLDFKKRQVTIDKVNSWVSKNTQNCIRGFLESCDIDSKLRMLIVNAIYFKGKWEYPFLKEQTKTKCFYSKPENCTLTQIMHMKGVFKHGCIDGMNADFIEMPYQSEHFSFIAILPHINSSLKEVKKLLKVEKLIAQVDHTIPVNVWVDMPKFDITCKQNMNKVLKVLGVKSAFNASEADFSKMSLSDINISKVIHKAMITCNEKGTVAAALSSVSVILRSSRCVKIFNANRPFLFLILFGKGVVFAGQITSFA